MARIPVSTTSSVLRFAVLVCAIRSFCPCAGRLSCSFIRGVFVDLTRERLRLDCRFRTGLPALDDLRDVIRLFKARGARFAGWTIWPRRLPAVA